jgi:hypothetical protein
MMNHERKMDYGVSTPPGIISSRNKVPTEEANAEKSISPFIRGARRAFAFSRRRIVVVIVFLCDDRHRDRRSGSNGKRARSLSSLLHTTDDDDEAGRFE